MSCVRCLLFILSWAISLERMKAKKRFLVNRIGMALRPFRPKDTANIMKKKNTPNNFREINHHYVMFTAREDLVCVFLLRLIMDKRVNEARGGFNGQTVKRINE